MGQKHGDQHTTAREAASDRNVLLEKSDEFITEEDSQDGENEK